MGCRTSPSGYIRWRVGTTTLCQRRLYPPIRDYEFGYMTKWKTNVSALRQIFAVYIQNIFCKLPAFSNVKSCQKKKTKNVQEVTKSLMKRAITHQKPNSWTYFFVEVSGHKDESSQTRGFRIQCLHYKPDSNQFFSGGGGGGVKNNINS